MNRLIIKDLIETVSTENIFSHSYKTSHREGMTYINLFRDERMTVKVYIFDPNRINPVHRNYFVWPHNHAYSFTTTVLAGRISEAKFKVDDNKSRLDRHCDGYMAGLYAHEVSTKTYVAGETYENTKSDVHTLLCPEEEVILLLVQMSDKSVGRSIYYPKGTRLDCRYERFESQAEFSLMLDKVKKLID